MVTQRPFEELNLWQRIFAEQWEAFKAGHGREQGCRVAGASQGAGFHAHGLPFGEDFSQCSAGSPRLLYPDGGEWRVELSLLASFPVPRRFAGSHKINHGDTYR